MKTLYLRLVLVFISLVLASLILVFFVGFRVYEVFLKNQVEQSLLAEGREMIQLHEETHPDDLDQFMNSIARLKGYRLYLYRSPEQFRLYGSDKPRHRIHLEQDEINQVLRGGIYRGITRTPDKKHMDPRVVGLPFQAGDQRYALFIQPKLESMMKKVRNLVVSFLVAVLIIGSLLVLLGSRYIVKPLQTITQAIQRLAKGDFDVHLNIKRKDELGTLVHSFNEMAGELRQLENMRQEFVSNVSHEIQSPLTSIRGFSEALKKEGLSKEERKQYLEIIGKESDRLSRLSDNLLKLASLESSHHPFQPATFKLDEQLRSVIIATEPQWSGKDLTLDVSLPETWIGADRDQLYQVWFNLVGNSIKFTPEGGKVRIHIEKKEDQVAVHIADTGIGISKGEQQRIFQRFYKADPARNPARSGSGLGLSIVKRIVELHQGEIRVESEAGEGTVFIVTLPAESSSHP